jgi:hypothetical protein
MESSSEDISVYFTRRYMVFKQRINVLLALSVPNKYLRIGDKKEPEGDSTRENVIMIMMMSL